MTSKFGYYQRNTQFLIAKYGRYTTKSRGGIFTPKTRKKIIAQAGTTRVGRSKNDFWFDRREDVKMGLLDLQLFLESANEGQIKRVINYDTIEPLIKLLLRQPIRDVQANKQDLVKTRIAGLFVELGLEYIRGMMGDKVTLSHTRTIDEAIDFEQFLGKFS